MKRETKLMHYGRSPQPGPANPPVVRASTILHETVASFRDTNKRREKDDTVLSYGRRGTTTAYALADAICDLEGGDASFLFPTGIAALAGAISAYSSSGDHVLIVDTIFPATRTYCENQLRRNGVEIDYFPADAIDIDEWVKPNTKAVILETPGSNTFDIMDLGKFCSNAKKHNLIIIADNTYGSGWYYRPLEFGCDVSVIAGTKYLSGHADVMMGIATSRQEISAPLRQLVHNTGQILAPDEAYACLRGMRTLNLRLERHEQTGFAIANWLSNRDEVMEVLHPGLSSHPRSEIWKRDSSGCNGMFSVKFKSDFAADDFMDSLTLFSIGTSWGGFESLVMPIEPYKNRKYKPENISLPMIRFQTGLEHQDDLLDDLSNAFSSLKETK